MATVIPSCISLFVFIGFIHMGVFASTAPSYCSYDEPENHFTCDYSMMSNPANRPIDFAQFDPEPQRLTVYVNGYFPYLGDTRVFSVDFSGINVAGFDGNYPASLTLDCGWYGSMYMQAGAFANMSHIQHLKIRNCYTYNVPAEAFKELVSLDYLAFEGGAIDWVDADAMASLSVEKLLFDSHTFPQTHGHFEVRNCVFNIKQVPPGLLFSWKNLTSATLRNADLSTVSADTFRYTTKLRYIDLSDNLFTNIPEGLFDGLDSLSEVHFYHIQWHCTCTNLWWYTYLRDRNVTIFGELMCESPAGSSVGKYWNDVCVETDLCAGQIGMEWKAKNVCVNLFDFLRYGYSMTAIIVMTVVLALVIHTKRQFPEAAGRPRGNRGTNLPMIPNIKKSRRVSDSEIEKKKMVDGGRRRDEKPRRPRDKQDEAWGESRYDSRQKDGSDRRGKDRRRRSNNDIEEDVFYV